MVMRMYGGCPNHIKGPFSDRPSDYRPYSYVKESSKKMSGNDIQTVNFKSWKYVWKFLRTWKTRWARLEILTRTGNTLKTVSNIFWWIFWRYFQKSWEVGSLNQSFCETEKLFTVLPFCFNTFGRRFVSRTSLINLSKSQMNSRFFKFLAWNYFQNRNLWISPSPLNF